MQYSGYDIIGDVHGCANTLEKLLQKLGYQRDADVYYHASRQIIFLGDIVDRGPHIREALRVVKAMVDAGTARCILGNHEYNALGYITPTPETENSRDIQYVRAHNTRHNRLIAETLTQFASYPEEWRMYLEWFRTLPAFLELPGFRVVHACWDDALIKEFKQRSLPMYYDKQFIQSSADKSTFAGQFLDRLTRGTDLTLPEGRSITSKDGYRRKLFRTKFWAKDPQTYQDVVFQPDPLPEDLAGQILAEHEKDKLLCYGADEPPVFVGHYWLQGKPRVLKPNIACLDYSAVKYGRLVAYRFDGEAALDNSKFEWVYVDANPEAS